MNRSRTSTVVPVGWAAGERSGGPPASTRTRVACSAPASRVVRVRAETEEIACSASPRKPKETTRPRSSAELILLVACRPTAVCASSGDIPEPSSRTRIREVPPPSISTSILEAPASKAFSMSSLTAEAGRSITSPAAIR